MVEHMSYYELREVVDQLLRERFLAETRIRVLGRISEAERVAGIIELTSVNEQLAELVPALVVKLNQFEEALGDDFLDNLGTTTES